MFVQGKTLRRRQEGRVEWRKKQSKAAFLSEATLVEKTIERSGEGLHCIGPRLWNGDIAMGKGCHITAHGGSRFCRIQVAEAAPWHLDTGNRTRRPCGIRKSSGPGENLVTKDLPKAGFDIRCQVKHSTAAIRRAETVCGIRGKLRGRSEGKVDFPPCLGRPMLYANFPLGKIGGWQVDGPGHRLLTNALGRAHDRGNLPFSQHVERALAAKTRAGI